MIKDYYSVLELDGISDLREVKKAYFKLIMQWHPDKNCNYTESKEIFIEIQEAYEFLNNSSKKTLYDNASWYNRRVMNVQQVILARYKVEMIIKIRKEMNIEPKIDAKFLKKVDYCNFEERIKDCQNKFSCRLYTVSVLEAIKDEQSKAQEIEKFKRDIASLEIDSLNIDSEDSLSIFGSNCSCYLSNNHIIVYKEHVTNCISNQEDIKAFFSKITALVNGKMKKIRTAIISEIEEEILDLNQEYNTVFVTSSTNWKSRIDACNRKECLLIRDQLFKEIHNQREALHKSSSNSIATTETERLSSDQWEILVDLLQIKERNNFNFDILKSEISKLKTENATFKRKEIEKEKHKLKIQLTKKWCILKKERQKITQEKNLSKRHLDILHRYLFADQKKVSQKIDSKNSFQKNVNQLEQHVGKENVSKLISIQETIIELEVKLSNLFEDEKRL